LSSHPEQSRKDTEAKITNSKAFFSKIVEEDGLKDRSGFLALLELERRSVAHGLSKGRYDQLSPAFFSLRVYLRFKSDGHIGAAIL
jgi:hypothetical protein